MKRVVSSSLITLFIILAVTASYFYLRNFNKSGGNPVNAIPADASFVLVYTPAKLNPGEIKKAEFWNVLIKAPAFKKLLNQISFLDSIRASDAKSKDFFNSDPWYISAHVSGSNEFDFLFSKTIGNGESESEITELIKELAGQNATFEERNYDGNTIRELNLNENSHLSFTFSKGIFLASFVPFIVEDALRQLKLGKPLTSDFDELSGSITSKGLDVYLNFNNLPSFLSVLIEPSVLEGSSSLKRISNWAAAAVSTSGNTIRLEGAHSVSDTTQLLSCLSGQSAVEMKMLKILPKKTVVIDYAGLSNLSLYYDKFSRQYQSEANREKKNRLIRSIAENYKFRIEDKMLEWVGNEMALVITEPSGLNFENNCYGVFKAKKIDVAKNSLKTISRIVDKKKNNKTMEETYNGHVIGYISLNGVLPAMFGETFNKIQKMYFTDIGEYIVFGNQASALRLFIDEFKSGSSLTGTSHFEFTQKKLPSKGNLFFYINPASSNYILKSVFNSKWKLLLENYKEILAGFNDACWLLSVENESYKMAGVLNFAQKEKSEGVYSSFTVETDSSVTLKPLITTDPINQTRQILFQDDAQVLYFVDNSGNIIWKQVMDGKIMGEIFEIDLFKNNSRQFLFNTRDYLYLLDTEGKQVGNYPIRLPSPATNGLSVFDFENKKDPKIFIACDNKRVYAYLPSGKPLPGWNFQQNIGVVTDKIRSIELNGKKFLVINDNEKGATIVSKFGEQGISLVEGFSVAKNSAFYKDPSGSLVTTDPSGNVIVITSDGLVQTIPLNATGPDHGFVFADADDDGDLDYIFLDGKELIAYNKSLTLIFRKEFDTTMDGPLQLVVLSNGKSALLMSSSTSNKTWMLKMDGTVYNGFPVKGSGKAVIDEINIDGKKNLFVGSMENNFNVYSLD